MIKVAAEIISNIQHSAIGILSTTGGAAGGAMVTGAVGAATGVPLTVMSG